MAANYDALKRYKTIDACLRDRTTSYTLRDLIDACIMAGARASVRTVQLDIQHMRDKKNGYGAPIKVIKNKYYTYSRPDFSIIRSGIKMNVLQEVAALVEKLKFYGSFESLSDVNYAIEILDEEVTAKKEKRRPVVSYQVRAHAIGTKYFKNIKDAILKKQTLCIGYHSSRSNRTMQIIFYPMFLKEFSGRWYALGYKEGMSKVYRLPLDRITELSDSILPFPANLSFDAKTYFRDFIGVTKLSGEKRKIIFMARNKLACYLEVNPLHHSQKLLKREENGDCEFSIEIIPNAEFFNIIYAYQPYITIISPRETGLEVNSRIAGIAEHMPDYNYNKQEDKVSIEEQLDNMPNLFSDIK
ncbi:MAG: WYL domain-containing protein [Bacteroidales bacterium]|jgi:predicted DNA-binding transcriptional regulator YafY|nr:WYL domain-containing protein [Bacteroidales bacterium]